MLANNLRSRFQLRNVVPHMRTSRSVNCRRARSSTTHKTSRTSINPVMQAQPFIRRYCAARDPRKDWGEMPPGMENLPNINIGQKRLEDIQNEGPVRKGFGGGIGWGAFILFCAVGSASYFWARQRRLEIEESRRRVQVAGEAKIGGNWSLVDHRGRPITSADLWGNYVLIYFGFTYCPDICPEELQKMAKALNQLEPEIQKKVVPVMITVDPWRDSVEHLAGYVKEFHPRLVGLTGTPQQIDDVSRAFRVYTSKGPEEEEGDYLMDHSIFMYLMDKNGKLLDYFGVAMDADEIAERMRNHMVIAGEIAEPGVIGQVKWWWQQKQKEQTVQRV